MSSDESETSAARWRFAGPATGGPVELKGPLAECLDFAIATAAAAGQSILAARRSEQVSYRYKGGYELVSTADKRSDALIRGAVGKRFPGHAIPPHASDRP